MRHPTASAGTQPAEQEGGQDGAGGSCSGVREGQAFGSPWVRWPARASVAGDTA